MTIQEFLAQTTKQSIPLSDLTTIAADRAAFGDDVVAAFRTQIELRTDVAVDILREAKASNKPDLLASEQRAWDNAIRERDAIMGLQQAVERRTEHKAHVPATQSARTTDDSVIEIASPVLGKEQRCSEWLQKRGAFAYAGERGVESLRFGAIVRALALGDRRGLSALEQRALAEGSDASGGYMVPEVLATAFIDRVRAAMVVMRAGAVTVPMTSDTLNIARIGQPDSVSPAVQTAAWKTENDDIEETDLLLERVQFKARTLPVLLKLSVELSEDAANIDQAIERELSQQLALELDRAALLGSGTPPEPRGVRNQSGVGVTSFSNAVPDDYDFLIDAIGRVWGQNFEPTARIYNAGLATVIAKFKSSVDSQPLSVPEAVAAVAAYRTNMIPSEAGSPDSTTLFVGDFSQLMVGLRTSFRLEMTRVAGEAFEKLQVWVRCYLRADIQLAHPEAFDVTTDVGI